MEKTAKRRPIHRSLRSHHGVESPYNSKGKTRTRAVLHRSFPGEFLAVVVGRGRDCIRVLGVKPHYLCLSWVLGEFS